MKWCSRPTIEVEDTFFQESQKWVATAGNDCALSLARIGPGGNWLGAYPPGNEVGRLDLSARHNEGLQ